MKLVITTNELSPCGDTANELTASTGAPLGGVSPWVGTCSAISPRDSGGPLLPEILLQRYWRNLDPFVISLTCASSTIAGPKYQMLPRDNLGRDFWQKQPPFMVYMDTLSWPAPWKACVEDPSAPQHMGKQALGQKQIPNSPTLTPYLGWENIVHHIPDVRTQDTLVGHGQPFQLH